MIEGKFLFSVNLTEDTINEFTVYLFLYCLIYINRFKPELNL